ncbi:MAG: UvrD-helicase domain-containing protein [Clostridiales bacterium]|jgi:DNA helicase-2/ATP-dependent DNA helicase PcrA|nr:UvrD-helicase domain-containing protein [Clostridiales bacterium]
MCLFDEFSAIRRRSLERKEYKNLNEKQKSAIFDLDGPLLVLAGAGSGKTTVIINRILNLVKYGNVGSVKSSITKDIVDKLKEFENSNKTEFENITGIQEYLEAGPVEPDSILAITFTNKAANEIKNRLQNCLGEDSKNIMISTFHSMCLKILKKNIFKIGLNDNFVIFDKYDQNAVVKECIKEINLDREKYKPKKVLNHISRAKNNFSNISEKEEIFNISDKNILEIYKMYNKRLVSYNALDFDDIIIKTIELFERDSETLKYYQDKYKYIMVDEFQDTNYAQCRIIKLLFKKYKNLCVVGDDDQSIYKFRGANVKNILNFENEFSGARVIKLEENYRSTKNILKVANEIIKNNSGRKEKKLWTNNQEGSKVKVFAAEREYLEADFVSSQIKKMMDVEGKNESDFAILYRNNSLSRNIESSLVRAKIPYKIFGGLRFYDRKEIKDLIAYIRLAQNTCDNISLKRIINEPKRGIGQTSVNKIEDIASEKNLSMYGVCKNIKDYSADIRSWSKIEKFVSIIEVLIENSKKENFNLEQFVSLVISKIGILFKLENSEAIEDKVRCENINEFIVSIHESVEKNPSISILEFLENISILSDIELSKEIENFVSLMTLHSAKGLEFPVVFLVGFEEGIFPNTRFFNSEEEIEEERRLCYVGVTRAKERLFVTWSKFRSSFIKTLNDKSEIKNVKNKPSMFIEEIPKNLIENLNNDLPDRCLENYTKKDKRECEYSQNFKNGDVVIHAKFGTGVILSIEDANHNDSKIEIMFDGFKKKLMFSNAKLERFE